MREERGRRSRKRWRRREEGGRRVRGRRGMREERGRRSRKRWRRREEGGRRVRGRRGMREERGRRSRKRWRVVGMEAERSTVKEENGRGMSAKLSAVSWRGEVDERTRQE